MIASVQSLNRAFRILYYVAGREGGATVAEISAGVELKPITAYKLIRTLEAERFLVRLGPPLRFTLGNAVHELKDLDDGRVWLTESGKALLQAQRDLPEANFVLLQWVAGNTYQRLAVETDCFGRLMRRRHRQVHPYEKASSLLFLAYSSEEEKAQFFAKHPFEADGAPFWGTQAELDRFLSGVRRRGWSHPVLPNEFHWRLAAPVWAPDGRILAAIGCFAKKKGISRERKQRMIAVCRNTAESLTRTMGTLMRQPWPDRYEDDSHWD